MFRYADITEKRNRKSLNNLRGVTWSVGLGNQKRRHDGAICEIRIVFIILTTVQRYEEHFQNSFVFTTLEW